MDNRVAVISEPFKIEYRRKAIPELKAGEVLIKSELIGICGTDLELYDGSLGYLRSGRIGYPLVAGHEFYGEVVAVGPQVHAFAVGDKVVSEMHIGCGACEACRRGRYNLCPDMRRLGIGDLPGALAEYFVAPDRFLHKVPAAVPPEQAVLLEPTAVGFYAVSRSGLAGGDKVLIFGPGPIGLIICAVARALGAAEIVVAGREKDADRLKLAAALGSTATVTVQADDPQALAGYRGWADIVFEATGHAEVASRAFGYVRRGGTLYLVGMYRSLGDGVDFSQVVVEEKRLLGGLGSPGVWDKVLGLVMGGRLPLMPLITHRFAFDELPQAFEAAYKRTDNVIKTVIDFK